MSNAPASAAASNPVQDVNGKMSSPPHLIPQPPLPMGPPSNLQPCLAPPSLPPPPRPPSPSDQHLHQLSHVEIIPQESLDFSKLHLYPPMAAEGGATHCFPTPPPPPIEQYPPPLPDQHAMFYNDGCSMDTMIVADANGGCGDFEEYSPQPKYISL